MNLATSVLRLGDIPIRRLFDALGIGRRFDVYSRHACDDRGRKDQQKTQIKFHGRTTTVWLAWILVLHRISVYSRVFECIRRYYGRCVLRCNVHTRGLIYLRSVISLPLHRRLVTEAETLVLYSRCPSSPQSPYFLRLFLPFGVITRR